MEKILNAKYKDVLKKIIIQNQSRLRNLKVIPRSIEIEEHGNYVFVGLRRAGKTYLFYQVIKAQYHIEEVLFVNFEDERLIEFSYKELDLLLEAYSELYKKKPVLFLDEIHNIKNWEKFVRRLADNDYKVMITGSNAKMLSSDISTTLGGRFFNIEVFPLSFIEFLKFNKLELEQNFEYSNQLIKIKELFAIFLQYGGLPELIKFKNKREYLSNIYQKLFYGDIIARYNISNPKALKLLVKKLAESVNNETSINRIKNMIKSVGVPIGSSTLFEYIDYLRESFIINDITNYANKFVERETKKKYYLSDTGLLALFLIDQDTKLLENLVYIELNRRHKDGVYYFKRKLEVDFYIPEEKILIQVSYNINEEETRKRELKALLLAMNELNIDEGKIITFDIEDQILIDNKIIHIIPAWKWLLKV